MKVKHKRRLIEKGGSCYVCIPSRVRKALGWKKGDLLVLYRVKGNGFYVFSENGVDGGPEDIKGPDGLVRSIFQGPKVQGKHSIKIPDPLLKGKNRADKTLVIIEQRAGSLSGAKVQGCPLRSFSDDLI